MAFWGSHPKQYWVIYDQGTCALGAIADHLGMARFISVLHGYAAAHRFGIATTADFKATIENAAQDVPGWDIAQFWRTWRIGTS
jgi:aminopeptidase N